MFELVLRVFASKRSLPFSDEVFEVNEAGRMLKRPVEDLKSYQLINIQTGFTRILDSW